MKHFRMVVPIPPFRLASGSRRRHIPPRMRPQSLALRSAAAVALVLIGTAAAGCGAAASKTSPSPSTFRNNFLAFGYPAGWKPTVFRITGTLHFSPMLYLASQPVHQPCHTHGGATVCGWPLDRLRPGGVLLVWENRGFPGWSLRTTQGISLRIGGRRAKRIVTRPGGCAAVGADETISVEIERPIPDNWTAFTACLKGPGLAAAESEVDALLASTRFVAP
jgi:hypothetical protein